MTSATDAKPQPEPVVLKGGRGLSMSQQVLIALVLGISAGLFLGEYSTRMKFVADIYIGLLQMMVLPYIIIALIGGIGKLTLVQAKQLAKYAVIVLLMMWVIIGTVLALLPLALPTLESASFFSTSLIETAKPVSLLDIFIPKNFFKSLANNQIPAVVIFCLALGIALIDTANKQELFKLFDVLAEAVMKVIKFVVKLTPIGVFVMTATAAGTMTFEDIGRLQAYFILYTVAVLILGFGVLPGLIASLTPFKYRDVITIAWSAMVLSFAAAKVLVALPLIIESIKELFQKYEIKDKNAVSMAEMLVPISYPFPNTGKLLSLFFVPFAAWFIGSPLGFSDYPALLTTGLLSYFGNVAVAMPFVLDLMQVPADMFQIFLLTGVYCGRMSDALGAMDMFTFAALVACFASGMVQIQWQRLIMILLGAVAVITVSIVGVRMYLEYVSEGAYDKDKIIAAMQLLENPEPFVMVEAGPNPVPLAEGQSRLERIRERGVVRIGYDPDRLPFSYINGQGDLVGFDIDMAHKLAEELGVSLEFVPFQFETLLQQLQDDHFDIAMAGVYGTAQWSENIRFSDPYEFATLSLVVPDYRDIEFATLGAIRELDRVKIGIHHSLGGEAASFKERLPNAEVVILDAYREFFEGRVEGVDALLTGAESGSAWTLLYPQYQVVTPFSDNYSIPLVYPFSAGEDNTMDEFIDHWVMLKQKDGTIQNAYDYWILGKGTEKRGPRWSVIRNVLGWVD
ncbi:MAG: cation:dicarboxylase symporter family transporter [Pseudomonadota bacterium]|nr:cation:dicarboxylase symporter family transporter [Pseudomonadota bacterium]